MNKLYLTMSQFLHPCRDSQHWRLACRPIFSLITAVKKISIQAVVFFYFQYFDNPKILSKYWTIYRGRINTERWLVNRQRRANNQKMYNRSFSVDLGLIEKYKFIHLFQFSFATFENSCLLSIPLFKNAKLCSLEIDSSH